MYYRWEERILTRMSEATLSAEALKQIQKRRTFAIISHPDAGKTTLTEKLLLYGGRHPPGRQRQGPQGRTSRDQRLDGNRKAARHQRDLQRHAV